MYENPGGAMAPPLPSLPTPMTASTSLPPTVQYDFAINFTTGHHHIFLLTSYLKYKIDKAKGSSCSYCTASAGSHSLLLAFTSTGSHSPLSELLLRALNEFTLLFLTSGPYFGVWLSSWVFV